MKLSKIAQHLGLKQVGGDVEITGVAPLEMAGSGDLSFITTAKWLGMSNRASALVVTPALGEQALQNRAGLISHAPALDAAQAALFLGRKTRAIVGIHPSAFIDPSAQLAAGVAVGPLAIIGPEAVIGPESVIHAGAVIHDRCVIGARCTIGTNVVIGEDGFGYEFVAGRHQKIPHFGIVYIEDDVDIGAATTIDRARFGETRIGAGTKIDNQVQIAHNVRIGRHCLIVSQVGIAGSCIIEDGVVLAGQAGVVPHVTIGQGARIAASTGVAGDVPPGRTWSGWWGLSHRDNMIQINSIRKLPAFMKQVRTFMKNWENKQ